VIVRSPLIEPGELVGKTAEEIDIYARSIGLIPRGPDPASGEGSYVDPLTGEQRILIHPKEGHFHVNTPAGERLDAAGRRLAPEAMAAHLSLGPAGEGIDDA
jgi:hypothetical protein